jgi:hypothetical protein
VLGSDEVHALENPEKSSIPGSRSLEQVQNVKTTDTSRIGDVGIRFSLDPSGKKSSNRKKTKGPKVVRGYVCLSCGTIDSPEWRRGPNGSKTLCNACGCKLVLLRKNATTTKYDSALGKEPEERAKRGARCLFYICYQTVIMNGAARLSASIVNSNEERVDVVLNVAS